MKHQRIPVFIILFSIILSSCMNKQDRPDDLFSYAKTRINDLQLSTYITAHAVRDLLTTEQGKREAVSILKGNGITKAYMEVYRSGLVIQKDLLEEVSQLFIRNGIDVVGGIATVPGKDFGVRQEGKLGWFNWQNKKTQQDLKKVMKMAAEVFDEFIVDDFLCTADTSTESEKAKGDRTWSQYRRDLLTRLSNEIFIQTAKEVNPNIKLIIKYPQWYDRFHLFGYDLSREPQLFDKVWVGTESRGQYTQRYGFVQPYEGFVNYRWIKDIVKEKIGGAWFDHGDCDENDFIEQAYQSVLAGATEIVIFNYYDFVNGHKGHHLLRTQFDQLSDLAKTVNINQAHGVYAYKPLNSDAGGDLYLMDFIGALGVPLIPVHEYPAEAKVIFLPTQAAADTAIVRKVNKSISNNSSIIFTTGFLVNSKGSEILTELAGIKYPLIQEPITAEFIESNKEKVKIESGLDLECKIDVTTGDVILNGIFDSKKIPFLVKSNNDKASIYTLNTHTFSQKDFDKVGEVLLCPKPLGLLEISREWANKIRDVFTNRLNFKLDAAPRIGIQLLGESDIVLHNYNNIEESLSFSYSDLSNTDFINGFTNDLINMENNSINIKMEPRSRIWLRKK